MRLLVYIRAETILALLARKGWTQQELAKQLGVSGWTITMMIQMKICPRPEVRNRLIEVFRGTSHKPGGRLTWDDLFKTELIDSNGTHV